MKEFNKAFAGLFTGVAISMVGVAKDFAAVGKQLLKQKSNGI